MYNDPNQPYQQNPNQPPYNPNQPNQQPPNQPYQQFPFQPGGQPMFAQPPQPPKKKRSKLGIGCLAVIIIIVLIGIISVATSSKATTTTTTTTTAGSTTTTSAATPTPAATQKALAWTTIKSFKGNGSQKTDTFSAPGTWKLLWTCDPASFSIAYNVIATIDSSDGSLVDTGVNATCKDGTTSGSTTVTSGGTLLLDVISEGDWTFTVQVQK